MRYASILLVLVALVAVAGFPIPAFAVLTAAILFFGMGWLVDEISVKMARACPSRISPRTSNATLTDEDKEFESYRPSPDLERLRELNVLLTIEENEKNRRRLEEQAETQKLLKEVNELKARVEALERGGSSWKA